MSNALDWSHVEIIANESNNIITEEPTPNDAPIFTITSDDDIYKSNNSFLIIYCDLLMQIVVFFALLYTMSSTNTIKYAQTVQSIQQALLTKSELNKVIAPTILSLSEIKKNIDNQLKESNMTEFVSTHIEDKGLRIIVNSTLFFESGDSVLLTSARPLLDSVAIILRKNPYNLMVEGHTDDVPIKTEKYSSNWSLSTLRATNVIEYFIEEKNLAAKRFTASGYAEHHPVAPNSSQENRSKNRRVEIIILPN